MKKTGRPSKTSRLDDHAIREVVMQFLTSFCKIRANSLKYGTNISISAVSYLLRKEFSLKSYKPTAKLCYDLFNFYISIFILLTRRKATEALYIG